MSPADEARLTRQACVEVGWMFAGAAGFFCLGFAFALSGVWR